MKVWLYRERTSLKAGEQESVLIVEYWYEIMFFYMEKYRDYPEDEILSRVGL